MWKLTWRHLFSEMLHLMWIVLRTAGMLRHQNVSSPTFRCDLALQTWRQVADWAGSASHPSSAHWRSSSHNPWCPPWCLLGQWGEPTSGRSGGLRRSRWSEIDVWRSAREYPGKCKCDRWPGCLYTVERSILKLPMWVRRKARVRRWHTCQGWYYGESKGLWHCFQKPLNWPLSLWLYQRGSQDTRGTRTGSSEEGQEINTCI